MTFDCFPVLWTVKENARKKITTRERKIVLRSITRAHLVAHLGLPQSGRSHLSSAVPILPPHLHGMTRGVGQCRSATHHSVTVSAHFQAFYLCPPPASSSFYLPQRLLPRSLSSLFAVPPSIETDMGAYSCLLGKQVLCSGVTRCHFIRDDATEPDCRCTSVTTSRDVAKVLATGIDEVVVSEYTGGATRDIFCSSSVS